MSASRGSKLKYGRPLIGIGLVLLVIGLIYRFGDQLTIDRLVAAEDLIRQQISEHPVRSWFVAFLLYVAITGASIPGATAATLMIGWAFGWLAGVPLVSFASTTGATFVFLATRYGFAELVRERLGERVDRLDRAVQQNGSMALLSLRLVPLFPFFVINLAMGLTRMRWTTYWWVSQLGMLPATIVYVGVGASIPDLKTLRDQGVRGLMTPWLFLSLLALAALPWVVRAIGRRWLGPTHIETPVDR